MRVRVFALGLTVLGASGCARTSLPELGGTEPGNPGARETPSIPAFPETALDATEPEPPANASGGYHGLERQLHLIADRQLDVNRDQVEELFAELHVQRMLVQAAANSAARRLERHGETEPGDETGSPSEP